MLVSAARAVAEELDLSPDWLNRKAAMFRWELPVGWRVRCHRLRDFGLLRVMLVGRADLIAAKVMGAPKRVQDREDLVVMNPTDAELDAVETRLDRIEAESERGRCEPQRAIVGWLRARR